MRYVERTADRITIRISPAQKEGFVIVCKRKICHGVIAGENYKLQKEENQITFKIIKDGYLWCAGYGKRRRTGCTDTVKLFQTSGGYTNRCGIIKPIRSCRNR